MSDEVDPASGRTFEAIDSYAEIEVTPSIHAELLTHYAVLGKKPRVKPEKQGGSLDGFDDCWRLYPRRDAKAAAKRAWMGQRCDQLLQIIAADIARRSASESWRETKYVPHMSTYINQRRWEDDPVEDRQETWL